MCLQGWLVVEVEFSHIICETKVENEQQRARQEVTVIISLRTLFTVGS